MSCLRVYKFYSAENALLNLEQRRLKISTLDDLNDPFEFRSVALRRPEDRTIWENTRSQLFINKGLICFCADWSNPVIWSHYAENHRGLALGFDIPSDLLLAVKYRKTRTKSKELNVKDRLFLEQLVKSSLSTKFIHWEYEKELRVFVGAETTCPDTGLFFKSFDDDLKLTEVVIGAESRINSQQIRQRVGALKPEIITARLAFKSYRVVKQQKRSLQR